MTARPGVWVALAWLAAGAARVEGAQTLVSPSAHFGASIFPEFEPVAQFGLHFDRFTEFGKDTAPDGAYTFARRYRLQKTIGTARSLRSAWCWRGRSSPLGGHDVVVE